MPARQSMAAFMAEQRTIENAPAGAARHGLATVRDAPPAAAAIPEPPAQPGDGPLAAAEQANLSTCEAALENLRMAFWAAGKALQTIRDGRLYRDGYDTFEAYCADRWEISRAEAYRLIAVWPLAERLSPIGDKLNKPQVLELLPVEKDHGQAAAELVYKTVAETDGVTITAARLHEVVGILPPGPFNADEAATQIRAYLNGELAPPSPTSPPAPLTAKDDRLAASLQRIAGGDDIKAAIAGEPAAVRRVVPVLRAALDRIEQGGGGG